MKKVEMELFRYGTLVFGKVLHVDESLRGKGTIIENDNFEISSVNIPDIDPYVLYLQGKDTASDDNIIYHNFYAEDEAIRVIESVQELISKLNDDDKSKAKVERVI